MNAWKDRAVVAGSIAEVGLAPLAIVTLYLTCTGTGYPWCLTLAAAVLSVAALIDIMNSRAEVENLVGARLARIEGMVAIPAAAAFAGGTFYHSAWLGWTGTVVIAALACHWSVAMAASRYRARFVPGWAKMMIAEAVREGRSCVHNYGMETVDPCHAIQAAAHTLADCLPCFRGSGRSKLSRYLFWVGMMERQVEDETDASTR